MEKMIALGRKYLLEKTDKTHIQFFRYIFVGGFATVVNAASLYILTSKLGVYYLVSAAIAFILGILTNYLLSILWVFKSTGKLTKEVILFVVIGIGGLALNELIMWGLVSGLRVYYMLAWLVATAVVLIWNFGMRKKFVFEGE